MSSLPLRRSFTALEALGLQSLRPTPSILSSQRFALHTRRAQSTSSTSTTANKPIPRPSPSTPNTPPKFTPSSSPSPSTSSTTTTTSSSTTSSPTTPNIAKTGLADKPLDLSPTGYDPSSEKIDWTRSFHGISSVPFSPEIVAVLLEEVNSEDVEIKPDGIVYLPEIKYRRILNKAFGPGGWGLVPRSESIVTPKTVTREWVNGKRLVSIARGEQDYFNPDGIPTATEGCKSNALVRCCKDLGVASELWDPRWIRKFKAAYTKEVFVEHVVNKRKSKIWIRKDEEVGYPWKVTK
ncbi:mitochondrial genome maintenance protein [Talaromyces pinophilus]|uniref:Mitochondrial genome maintenance protein MGM101 n=1 Tax=Talaromyces pinophilus TaxID=128442 RepID=A0A0B8N3Q4_TALPI|nr:mitochondrial genome maintenance protein [Talaromyces pinophilus]